MKIVPYKKLTSIHIESSEEEPEQKTTTTTTTTTWIKSIKNYGISFALKVTGVFLLSCIIVGLQIAMTISSKSENQLKVDILLKHLQLEQLQLQQSKEIISTICESCGGESSSETETETDIAGAIRQIPMNEVNIVPGAAVNKISKKKNDTIIISDLYILPKSLLSKNNSMNNSNSNFTKNGNISIANSSNSIANTTNSTTNGSNHHHHVNSSGGGDVGGSSHVLKIITRKTNDDTINNNNKKQSQSSSEYLDNVFFSVKSTKRFHESRLGPVLKTWFNLAKEQTWIFTDDDDPELMEKTNGHVINTHCPSTHYRQALCCKMAAEFDTFIQTTKSWFCHFDDDNYVNVPVLLEMLGKYNSREYWYLGKPSLKSPIKIQDPDNHTEEVSFWFATGGAGFCLSRALALRMSPLASGGKFTKICDRIQLPDDVTVGYIAGHLLNQKLTVIPQFHSHFETMKFIDMKNPSSEITFSYVHYPEYENVLQIDGFSTKEDPTRFLSLHCQLFPNFSICSNNNMNNTNLNQQRRRRR